ncbi:MAG: hypothetical protein ABH851_02870 [Methanobacteriota archaeon]
MNERELKKKANSLRHEVDSRRKRLSDIFSNLRVHQSDSRELKKKRDSLNDEIKELSQKIKVYKGKRDKLNKAVGKLASSRRKFMGDLKHLGGKQSDSKKIRTQLENNVKNTEQLIEGVLKDKFSVFVSEEIPLRDEKRLFDLILDLSAKLIAARDASKIQEKIMEDFKDSEELSSRLGSMGDEFSVLSEISDEYHKKVIETYEEIRKKKALSSESHSKLKEKYAEMDPLRKQIAGIKEEIAKLQEEITPINEELEDIRRKREEKKKLELAKEAKEKLKTSKRVSLDDLKMILDHWKID